MRHTKNCVRCYAKAVTWTGHVLKARAWFQPKGRRESILAGWCSRCQRKHEGFVGHYTSKLGAGEDDT